MPTTSKPFQNAEQDLAKAENIRKENLKRKRDERESEQARAENQNLRERLAAANARIQNLENRPAPPVGEDVRNRLTEQAAHITRLAADNQRQILEIARLTQANQDIQRQLAQARPGIEEGGVGPVHGQPAAGPANPRSVDPNYADQTQYMNVTLQGERGRQHWSRRETALDRPVQPREKVAFFRLGGKQSQELNPPGAGAPFVIPAGVDTRRFARTEPPFLNTANVISRSPSPIENDPLKFPDKIFYSVQFQDKIDALRLSENGVKIARLLKKGAAEANAHQNMFEKENALICCDKPQVDRRPLLRWRAFHPDTGVIMSHQETQDLHKDLSRRARERSRDISPQAR